MKHLKKFENKSVSDSEIENMFKELKFHDDKHREIDKKLADICLDKIAQYLDNDPYKAKKLFYDFYKNTYEKDGEMTAPFSFEKDFVLMEINKHLKIKNDADKYNL